MSYNFEFKAKTLKFNLEPPHIEKLQIMEKKIRNYKWQVKRRVFLLKMFISAGNVPLGTRTYKCEELDDTNDPKMLQNL